MVLPNASLSCADGRAVFKSSNGNNHSAHFSHALMAALWDIMLGYSFQCRIPFKSSKGNNHCVPFSHAMVAAL